MTDDVPASQLPFGRGIDEAVFRAIGELLVAASFAENVVLYQLITVLAAGTPHDAAGFFVATSRLDFGPKLQTLKIAVRGMTNPRFSQDMKDEILNRCDELSTVFARRNLFAHSFITASKKRADRVAVIDFRFKDSNKRAQAELFTADQIRSLAREIGRCTDNLVASVVRAGFPILGDNSEFTRT